ncbi:DUF6468 domain-containing protein [Methylobacterium isbiliense]|jgi:hypothetical protein|uniref:DUF6468 domain-containing protein n=1 Tax=Methylobacterium isbiliense TaxID=315478 RepID=A0ABQ4S6X1_9HYPH|nr:DUF6468 domain-containing protein [Methylobacterium isbiliense]MDN3623148.1 DUF6468 domain-containing protein [Methylobacterium isbiliense]GJD98218.1 hypothetical protein GMJLKIPL_0125 [Methylobacterium isbiliense]
MSAFVSILADCLVAVLLVASIVSSVALSRRITRLKADEAALRQTIGDLMVATESAERAILGLRGTLGECERTLAERLGVAEATAATLTAQVRAGEEVVERIGRIVAQARPGPAAGAPAVQAPAAAAPAAPAPEPLPAVSTSERMSAAAAAARALSERALSRLQSQAA